MQVQPSSGQNMHLTKNPAPAPSSLLSSPKALRHREETGQAGGSHRKDWLTRSQETRSQSAETPVFVPGWGRKGGAF